MIGNTPLELDHTSQSAVPACLQLTRDESVLRIGRVILSEGSISGVPRRLEIAGHGLPCLVTLHCGLCLGLSRSLHRRRLQDAEQRRLDDVIDTQSPECDATGLSVVEPSANACITRDLTLGPRTAR